MWATLAGGPRRSGTLAGMRLATVDDGTRDGSLIVVDSLGRGYASAAGIAPCLQRALDDWDQVAPQLRELAGSLERGTIAAHPLAHAKLRAPLPRAFEWVDGSAYINHIELVRRARGAEPPETLRTDPLVYQGGSGVLLGPTDPIQLADAAWGLDFEAEICVVLADTPRGTSAANAHRYVRLLMLANDLTLRHLVPAELQKGFGFFQSKPATAFSPFAVTPDELASSWQDGRVHRPLLSTYNGERIGDPEAGPEMHFSFFDLIEHIARTRSFCAGTILGSGTVSNRDERRGVSCLAERRMRELLRTGKIETPFMSVSDTVRIEMFDDVGRNVFGSIEQRVVAESTQ